MGERKGDGWMRKAERQWRKQPYLVQVSCIAQALAQHIRQMGKAVLPSQPIEGRQAESEGCQCSWTDVLAVSEAMLVMVFVLVLELVLFVLESRVVGCYELIVSGHGILVMQQHRLEEMEVPAEEGRDNDEEGENEDTRPYLHLRHYVRPDAEDDSPGIHQKHRLALVEALCDEAVMDVAAIGLSDAHMGTAAADDGREGVEDGDASDNKRDDDGREASDAGDIQKRDGA